MSRNSGAWGISMWKDGRGDVLSPPEEGISLEGGDAIVPYLPTVPVGCLLLPPDGMGVPPVRNGDVAFAQRDGVVQFGDYYEPRILTFEVSVDGDGCPGCGPEVLDTFLLLDGISPGRAETANRPAVHDLAVTDDLDIKAHVALDDWTPAANMAFVSKFIGSTERSYIFQALTTGPLRLIWNEDGTAATQRSAQSTIAPTVVNGEPLWVRVKLDVDNGAAGRDIIFETSDNGVTWTQLGTTVTQAGITSVFNSTTDIEVGAHSGGTQDRLAGEVYYAEVRRGIDGTVIASPDFTDQGVGTVQFYDAQDNLWSIVEPGMMAAAPASPAPLSARQKVARLTEEWSRNCDGASLAIFSDCHNPDALDEEKVYNGPYIVHGRPRVAQVAWRRSDIGGADVTLRFDCEDAALRLIVDSDVGQFWNADHTVDVEAGGGGGNMLPDYRLDTRTMTTNGGTMQDTHLSAGAPDGGSYFQRVVQVPNVSSPMSMNLDDTGVNGVPVVAGQSYTVSWWAKKSPAGGPATRVDFTWYDAAGAVISSNTGAANSPTADWQRFSQTNAAPALAAFAQPRLIWTGIALAGQNLDFAQAWMNEGVTATGPAMIDVVGDLCVFPEITLFGNLTAPITVFYGPWQFEYNDDIGPLDNVTIDTRWGRANAITVDSTQFLSGNYTSPLAPGTWDFSITTADPTDDGSARIQWYNAVVSG